MVSFFLEPIWQFRLALGAIYAVVGLSLNFIIGHAGELSLGHQAFVGIGAFIAAATASSALDNTFAGMIAGALVGVMIALLLGAVALRVRGLYLALLTLSFGIAVQSSVLELDWLAGGSAGVTSGRPFFASSDLAFFLLTAAVLFAVGWIDGNFGRSKVGRALAAVRTNDRLASALGIDVVRYKLIAFVFSGAAAGLAGALYAQWRGALSSTEFSVQLALLFVTMTVVGGLRSRLGIIVASSSLAIFVPLVELIGPLVDLIGPTRVPLVLPAVGSLLLVITLVKTPGGVAQGLGDMADGLDWLVRKGKRPDLAEASASMASVGAGVGSNGGLAARAAAIDNGVTAPTGAATLKVEHIQVSFGGLRVLEDVSLTAEAGCVTGLIGPNGAGKTTAFNVISGFISSPSGRILLDDVDISAMPAHRRAELGIGRTFQHVGLITEMTVLENLEMMAHRQVGYSVVAGVLSLPAARQFDQEMRTRVLESLEQAGLAHLAAQRVDSLPYGYRKMVEIVGIMMMEPRVLLLDEPSSGMAREEARAFGQQIRAIRDHMNVTVLMIEHHVPLVMDVCDYVVALSSGRVIAHDIPEIVRQDDEVIEAYLGVKA